MKKKLKCKVCDTRFSPKSEKLYLVKERVSGLALLAGGANPRVLECFDCPSCGCQNMVNIRATEPISGPDTPGAADADESDLMSGEMSGHE